LAPKQKNVDFSIITPVYNGENWISETIRSVLENCKGFDFEYIVVNDGSSDNTLKCMLNFSQEIQIIDQENQGEAESVNTGLRLAKGKYILVVSADDPMRSPELLRLAQEAFEQDKSVVCAYPSWSVIDGNSHVLRNVDVEDFSERSLIGQHKCIVGPGGVFSRATALEIGGRRSNLKFTSDYEFWLRLSQKGRFIRIPGYLAYWREHELSTSIAQRGLIMANERISVMRDFLSENPQLQKNLKQMAISSAYYQAALLVYFDRNVPAKKLLWQALLTYPKNLFAFDVKILLFILLSPYSRIVLRILKKLGLYGKLPKNA
jgi:glycosyltransferase involved in cell wall biosynthesis